LSAVDTHVGRQLFDNVIGPKGVLKDKTRVLVTHRVSILPHVDQIIVLKDGSISESGTYKQLIAKEGDFAEFVTEYLTERMDLDLDNEEMDKIVEEVKPLIERRISKSESIEGNVKKIIRSSSVVSTLNKDINNEKQEQKTDLPKDIGKLIEAETSETGTVKFTVYKRYVQTIGYCFCTFIFFGFVASNVAQVLTSLWLSECSNGALDPNKINDTNLRDLRLGVYAGIGITECIFTLIANLSVSLAGIRAAKLLHNNMLKRIIRAPMSFFGI